MCALALLLTCTGGIASEEDTGHELNPEVTAETENNETVALDLAAMNQEELTNIPVQTSLVETVSDSETIEEAVLQAESNHDSEHTVQAEVVEAAADSNTSEEPSEEEKAAESNEFPEEPSGDDKQDEVEPKPGQNDQESGTVDDEHKVPDENPTSGDSSKDEKQTEVLSMGTPETLLPNGDAERVAGEQSQAASNNNSRDISTELNHDPDTTTLEIPVLNPYGENKIKDILSKSQPYTFAVFSTYTCDALFTLRVPMEDSVIVTLKDAPISLTRVENSNETDTTVTYTFEKTLVQESEHTLVLKTEKDGYVQFEITVALKDNFSENEKTDIQIVDSELSADDTESEELGSESEANVTESEETDTEMKNDLLVEDGQEIDTEEDRSVSFVIEWDNEYPVIGDVAHFKAVLKGYEDTKYSVQWEMSEDNENWQAVEGETSETMDIISSEENCRIYWRVTVFTDK